MKINVMKTSLMGLTAAVALGVSGLAMAAPQNTDAKARPQLTEQQKAQMAQKRFERQYDYLNLSKSQQAKIKTIEEQYRPVRPNIVNKDQDAEHQAFKANIEKLRAERLNLLQSKQFNDSAAAQLLSQEQALHQQMQAKHQQERASVQLNQLRKEHAIFQVLDKKQQQAYLERAKQPRPMMGMAAPHKKGPKAAPHHKKHPDSAKRAVPAKPAAQ